jgi:exodeoxyribonuclease VII small subunit
MTDGKMGMADWRHTTNPEIAMTEDNETEIRFEAAVGRLEQIVESLERGEPDLAAALSKYETGVRLLSQCYGLLDRADRAVALLAGVDEQGKPLTAPRRPSSESLRRTPAKPPSNDDDEPKPSLTNRSIRSIRRSESAQSSRIFEVHRSPLFPSNTKPDI